MERTYAVRYVGEGVRAVPGVGVFQTGTTVHLPAEQATKLALEDGFVLVGGGPPASRVVFRIGQREPGEPLTPIPSPGGRGEPMGKGDHAGEPGAEHAPPSPSTPPPPEGEERPGPC